MVRTNSWRDRSWAAQHRPEQIRTIEMALLSGCFLDTPPWDMEMLRSDTECPAAPGRQVAWHSLGTWLVSDGDRAWVLWSHSESINRWIRLPISDTDEREAVEITRWIDDYELDDEACRLAFRLGTFWADA